MHSDGKADVGTALIIYNSIRHYEIGKNGKDFLHATSVVVEAWNSYITISTIYSLPKHIIKSEQYIPFLKSQVIVSSL